MMNVCGRYWYSLEEPLMSSKPMRRIFSLSMDGTEDHSVISVSCDKLVFPA